MPVRAAVFKLDRGWTGVAATPHGIARVFLPSRRKADVEHGLKRCERIDPNDPRLFGAPAMLKAYFSGQETLNELPLDLLGTSSFVRLVLDVTRTIGYGEQQCYSWVASQIGTPGLSRAVGTALGRNPVPVLVPCHRVLTKDGSLGGFSGGRALKAAMLQLEGWAAARSPTLDGPARRQSRSHQALAIYLPDG